MDTKLFNAFNTEESYAILFIMIVAFLFGLLVGLLLRGARIRQLRKALSDSEAQRSALQVEHDALKGTVADMEQRLLKAEEDLRTLMEKLERSGRDNLRLTSELQQAARDAEQQKAILQVHLDEIEELSQQRLSLQSHNERLEQVIDAEDSHLVPLAEMQSSFNATAQRLEAFDARLSELTNENEHLKQELAALKYAQQETLAAVAAAAAAPPAPPLEIVPAEEADPERGLMFGAEKQVLTARVSAEDYIKDDLSKIDGIGPFVESKLHEIGVHTYEDIAAFDEARIAEVTRLIAYFPGRIEKDDWVGQAARLVGDKQSRGAATAAVHDPTDLQTVEGIGPKIEQLFKEAGINTWSELADTPVERLRDILSAAGDNYRIHDPATWPNQARLAANGEWALLEQYQIELKGGRVVQ